MKKRLLVIAGPTATGKTRLAAKLTKKFNGIIISADSRQVYKYMDVGTGKDKPKGVDIKGYDLVMPNEEFSVKKYLDFASAEINNAFAKGVNPILAGGSGLYIKAVVDSLDRVAIPRDTALREKLKGVDAKSLYKMVYKKDKNSALSLNNSDKNNPRRLVRMLEILKHKGTKPMAKNADYDEVLFIGLKLSMNELAERIKNRVDKRISDNFDEEVRYLIAMGFGDGAPARTLGYKQWIGYKKGNISMEEAKIEWGKEEIKYAKRQMTWFKKDPRIIWFDAGDKKYEDKIENLVKKWYSSN